jgi:hypothetical protein
MMKAAGRRLALFMVMVCLFASTSRAASTSSARPNWSKFLLILPNASAPPTLAHDLGGEELERYDDMLLAYGPSDAIAAISTRARTANVEMIPRDDFDLLQLPGGTIDTRKGTQASLPGRALMPVPAEGVTATWMIQFIGPPQKSWEASVAATGATLVQYIPYNGFIVTGTASAMRAVAQLPFVQFVDIYHQSLKAVMVPRGQPKGVDVLIIIPDGPFSDPLIARIRNLSDSVLPPLLVGPYLQIPAHVSDVAIEALLTEPLLIALVETPRLQFSDERVATSLTPNIDPTTGMPLQPKGYKRWLGDACEFCGSLQNDGFRVGIADTGIDGGQSTGPDPNPPLINAGLHRTDLPETRIQYGSDFSSSPVYPPAGTKGYLYDGSGHGTMVAGVVAANPPAGAASDVGGFYWGSGIAPSVGIFVTKITPDPFFTDSQGTRYVNITEEARDAVTNGAYIQNHSRNQYRSIARVSGTCNPVYDGQYTVVSQNFDAAVLNWPITLTVSAGNQSQQMVDSICPANTLLSIPPATAKNVIAVGGAENTRDPSDQWHCFGTRADSFLNIMSNSMHGTKVTGRFKPDLMAPSSEVVSLQSNTAPNQGVSFCMDNTSPPTFTDYYAAAGTSFAAPVGAASSVLAARVFAEAISPGCASAHTCSASAASPALIKGMLVASARSMRGGEDRALAAPWSPDHKYNAGTIARPTVATGRYYFASAVAQPGFSAHSEPATWPTSTGGTVVDNNVTWKEITWQASQAYSLSDPARPTTSNGHLYRAIVAGTSGGAEPSWLTSSGATFSDGGVTWQEIGTTTVGSLPNTQQGFGRISLSDLLSSYPHKIYENQTRSTSIGGTLTSTYKVHDATLPVTVVLTWSDPPAQVGSDPTVGLSTNPLVNDLNLSVELGSPSCTSRYIGNLTTVVSQSHGEESISYGCTDFVQFDSVNNVELVRFWAAAGTQFTVKITEVSGSSSQSFALVLENAYDSAVGPPPATPTSFSATATSTSTVSVSWALVSGATSYEVQRKSAGGSYSTIGTPASAGYSDGGLAPATTYVYRVRAKNATGVSAYTTPDPATTILFSDDPLVAQQTVIRKAHVDELRTAANALRTAAGLAAYPFTDPTITVGQTTVKVVHINELRGAIEPAQDLLQVPRIGYNHPMLTQGSSTVSAIDVQELRNGLK